MYQLTLILPDGSHVLTMPSPVNARFVHLNPTESLAALSDDGLAPADWVQVDTFARVASAVHVDDDRAALYVRTAA